MQPVRTFLVALLVAVLALAPSQALAKGASSGPGSANAIVKACDADNYQLKGHFSVKQLQRAYNSIPVSVREYTTCSQVILNAINAAESGHLKGGGTSSGGGGGFPVLIVVIVVILLAGMGATFYAYRRSRRGSDGAAGSPPDRPDGASSAQDSFEG